ncbi:MAG: response regulator [Candidatus Hermodarchaeota archaeon]
MATIFIVDDDQSLQRLYALILKEAGFEILDTAINGNDAVDKYRNFKIKPDIILMDHRMPIKNGLAAMIEILKLNQNEKIIFASADITVKKEALSIGACAFLDKPFKMHELLTVIQHIVKELIIER